MYRRAFGVDVPPSATRRRVAEIRQRHLLRTSILTSRAKPIAGDRERACGLLLGARLPPPTIGATEGLTQRNVRVRAVMTDTEMQLEKCRFILPINGAGVHAAISSKPSLCPLVATLGAKTV
jgi:hypothetical protein